MLFDSLDTDATNFYKNEGYLHLRNHNSQFIDRINFLKNYYENATPADGDKAFRGPDGSPKQFVNIFRDKKSTSFDLFQSPIISSLIDNFFNERVIFTHAKVSFKTPFKEANWYFHQDNGYKGNHDLRSGFTIFICLEDMNEKNGCLKLVPRSHKLGKLEHVRKVEHEESGDNQFILPKLPKGLDFHSVISLKGDIIIFHSNTIHGSGSSQVESRRLALISEVEPYDRPKLDDYGLVPIFAKGDLPYYDQIVLSLRRFINPLSIWFLIKKRSPKLTSFIRKIRY